MSFIDHGAERLLWKAVLFVGGILGPARGRWLACLVIRLTYLTDASWLKAVYRVSRRTPEPTPGLVHVPEEWSGHRPLVTVRRLGLTLALDLRDNLQRTLYYTGTYEPGLNRLLRAELRRGDVVLDLGAHIGVHALTAARVLGKRGGGRVVGFEPAHDSAQKLRANAARNRLDVTVVEAALGRATGTVDLRADRAYDEADAGVRSQFGTGARVQTVSVIMMDDWVRESGLDRLDLVKVDVEGAELEALEGMRESLQRLRPRLVVVEVKPAILERAGVPDSAVRGLLATCRYAPTGQVLHRNEVFRRVEC
jgi:FkbM family methyltransferase